ncbi:hypothetical protein [Clostridium tertium]|uniref:hypothetical protein n=1 Tax=Clostridium tertium TaxID=1559 RepID=UPI0023B29E4E|nr:hypothetical protein [Clostridium tertium]
MGLLDELDLDLNLNVSNEIAIGDHEIINDNEMEDYGNRITVNASQLMPVISKYSFLARNKQLEDQLIKIFCVDGSMFICADNIRYFYSTMYENVDMTKKAFVFYIPYKQLSVIIKAGAKLNDSITFTITDVIVASTGKTSWEIPMIDGNLDLDLVLKYYEIEEYNDEISRSKLFDILKMYQPFVTLSDETLTFNEGFAFCRSNHFYLWSSLALNDCYVLSKENIKLISTLGDGNETIVLLTNTQDKLMLRCGEDVLVTDRIAGNSTILPEIADLKRKQGVAMLKNTLLEKLKEIDIYSKRNLTLSFEPQGLRLINRDNAGGMAETLIEIDKDLCSVVNKESYNIQFDILEECVKCIKEDVMELMTLNRTEYIQFRTPTINCLLMVNY